MATWDDLATAEPELAADGRRLLRRTGIGEGLLATIRDDLPPRINPVYAEIVDGRLLTFVQARSAKATDLEADPRYRHTMEGPDDMPALSVRIEISSMLPTISATATDTAVMVML